MATSDQIKALVRAHIEGDNERFRSVVLVLAAHAEGKSFALAKSLRELAERRPREQAFTVLPQQMTQLLVPTRPTVNMDDMALDDSTWEPIQRFLLEQSSRDKLSEHGLRPMRKLLFVGPPGVGKTMMASALANALDIPLLRVQLHATISSHLGETAAQLGKIFDNIRGMRGVYLFDEFDALAAERGSANHDVGEMRRVCNSLLQFIELDDSESVIVAATNHHGILDRAMFRRFDEVVHFPMPSEAVAESLIRSRLIFNTGINWEAVRRVTDGIGHADLASACERVCKDAVLADRDHVDTSDLVAAIEARRVH